MLRRWTAADDRSLLGMYRAGAPRGQIAANLGRSEDAVDARRRYLAEGRRSAPARPFSQAEDRFLTAASRARVPIAEIAARLHRSPSEVCRRRRRLGLTGPPARPYSAADDRALARGLAGGRTLAAVAAELGRSEGALRLHARARGLVGGSPRRHWTPAEDRLLRHGYATGRSARWIHRQLLPGRSQGAIVARAHLLGIALHARRWTRDEERALADLLGRGGSVEAAARMLGRSGEAIRIRGRRLGLPLPAPAASRRPGTWTPAEDELLRRRPLDGAAALAATLGRSETAVRRRRRRLGISPPGGRSQHHPQADTGLARRRLIESQPDISPTRALALCRRLGIPLAQLSQRRAAVPR